MNNAEKVTLKAPACVPGATPLPERKVVRLTLPGRAELAAGMTVASNDGHSITVGNDDGNRIPTTAPTGEMTLRITESHRIPTTAPKTFRWRGALLTPADFEEEEYMVEFLEEEAGELEAMRCIRGDLCYYATLAKTTAGAWFMLWSECHPQLGTFDECFGFPKPRRFEPPQAEHSAENAAVWHARLQRFPSSYYAQPLSRREAFLIIARFYLPEEFLADAGVASR